MYDEKLGCCPSPDENPRLTIAELALTTHATIIRAHCILDEIERLLGNEVCEKRNIESPSGLISNCQQNLDLVRGLEDRISDLAHCLGAN